MNNSSSNFSLKKHTKSISRVASIIANNPDLARQQISQILAYADVIELRLDHWEKLQIADVAELCEEIDRPMILTLRSRSQGGQCQLDESDRLVWVEQLAKLKPAYIDLEWDVPIAFVSKLRAAYPSVQWIRSYHDFNQTPADLAALFQQVFQSNTDIYKLATFANSICDTLRFLIFLQKISQSHRVIGMTMGEYGSVSRILAPVVGSLLAYGSVNADTVSAPGQLTLAELTDIYHVQCLNRETKIYALLGDPVSQSPGHQYHNAHFTRSQKNAVYVKLHVCSAELAHAFSLCQQLPFYGFSVTMPHKETIVPLLDDLSVQSKSMQIVNTISREHDNYQGFNTDSMASVAILQREKIRISKARILILGAGGSAKAIAYALHEQGGEITLCNRTLARAQSFVAAYGGQCIDVETLFSYSDISYDVIINTLPADAFIAQCEDWPFPKATQNTAQLAMDIVLKPARTRFIEKAERAGWRCIGGDAFFAEQALLQLQIWQ